jgi:GTPase involved in cell partitioning and DNA repair
VLAKGGQHFVVADIPGLIPEAHNGKSWCGERPKYSNQSQTRI